MHEGLAASYPTICAALRHHARVAPEAVAIRFDGRTVSYEDLFSSATRIASALRRQGIGKDDVVLLELPRGEHMLMAMAGVMLAGAAYCVTELDPGRAGQPDRSDHPAVTAVIRARGTEARGPRPSLRFESLLVAEDEPSGDAEGPAPSALAYVLFTSGSTGAPKAAGITHANLSHYCAALCERLGVHRPTSAAHISSLEADLGNTSLFLAWWTGGAVCVATHEQRRDPAEAARWITDEKPRVLKITPSHWQALLPTLRAEAAGKPLLDQLIFGGERLTFDLAHETASSRTTKTFWNHYGPTETTIGVAAMQVEDVDRLARQGFSSVPLGTLLGRGTLRVLDDDGQVAALPAIGELYIGGPGVGAGYVGDEPRTAQAFLTLPGCEGRFYRTGDRVRVDGSGCIEFLGRRDRQVKVAGFRIELDAVEAQVRMAAATQQAACVMLENAGKPRLVVLLVPTDATPPLKDVRQRLDGFLGLPSPLRIVLLDDWPLNPNGKTDYKALTASARAMDDELERGVPSSPMTALESEVHGVWCACLGRQRVGLDEAFDAIGGDSLDAIRIVGALHARGYRLTAADFLSAGTIRQLCSLLTRGNVQELLVPANGECRVTAAGEEWLASTQLPDGHHWNQAVLLSLPANMGMGRLAEAVRAVATRHPLLGCTVRVSPTPAFIERRSVDVFTHEDIGAGGGDAAVEASCTRVQRSINPFDGPAFRAHAMRHMAGEACESVSLLLCGHHLVVDAVSWRLILADLQDALDGRPFAKQMDAEFDKIHTWNVTGDAMRRASAPRIRAYLDAALPTPEAPSDCLEGEVTSYWIGYDAVDTERLRRAASNERVPLATLVLAAFQKALAPGQAGTPAWIDVEGHGRIRRHARGDVSTAAGWFTAVTPVSIAPSTARHAGRHVQDVLDRIPREVLDLGVTAGDYRGTRTTPPRVCFNFLGDFPLERGDVPMAFSRAYPGASRGPGNARRHVLTLTARIMDGGLWLDLVGLEHGSYDAQATTARLARVLTDWAGVEHKAPVNAPSSAGNLAHVPRDVQRVTAIRGALATARARHRVITGATGFIGSHVLLELLRRTDDPVTCLVRGTDEAHAMARLRNAVECYHGDEAWKLHAERIHVVRAELSARRLGLAPSEYGWLVDHAMAIYNLAANVNLAAPEHELASINVRGVEELLALAGAAGGIDIHHMSTLAVAGYNSAPAAICFDESARDIGQWFRSPYEKTKLEAERLVHEYALRGSRALTYRTGNVTAHSVTGVFQRNAPENQFVQLLIALSQLGQWPAEARYDIVLSPVDRVARAMTGISLDPACTSGTYHVESHHAFDARRLFGAMERHGVAQASRLHGSLSQLLEGAKDSSREAALSHFWLNRPAQNVSFDHSRTGKVLARIGDGFNALDDAWADAFITHLLHTGTLDRGCRQPSAGFEDIAS